MKTKRLKIIKAGRLVYAVCYSQPMRRDTPKQRAAKAKCSTEARKRMNLKRAWQKLELILAANFEAGDFFITLTFDDSHLPTDRAAVRAAVKRYFRKLRSIRQTPLKYVYCIEGHPPAAGGPRRFHVHIVANSGDNSTEAFESLWGLGNVKIERLDATGNSYGDLARYLTKEAREPGRPAGRRSWTPSENLEKPISESKMVNEDLDLITPLGAEELEKESFTNCFGAFTYLKYIYLEPQKKKKKTYNLKLGSNVYSVSSNGEKTGKALIQAKKSANMGP